MTDSGYSLSHGNTSYLQYLKPASVDLKTFNPKHYRELGGVLGLTFQS